MKCLTEDKALAVITNRIIDTWTDEELKTFVWDRMYDEIKNEPGKLEKLAKAHNISIVKEKDNG